MSKTRTKGTTIGVHLTLRTDDTVRRAAAAVKQSPGVYLSGLIEAAFAGGVPKVLPPNVKALDARARARHPSAVRERAAPCPHRQRMLLSGGLARCKDCGAVRRSDGSWGEPS